MMELPEAYAVAEQINQTIRDKTIAKVVAAQSPHKFAWYHGDPQSYHGLLAGQIIGSAQGYGGMVEIEARSMALLFGDGVGLRYLAAGEQRPPKHQLLIEFEDETALTGTVQMYGGMWCFKRGEFDNPYYLAAKAKPSPLTEDFNEAYFDQMTSSPDVQKLSAKAFLATEQRIPGLGNGVLQDILWKVKIHPKCKLNTLDDRKKEALFQAIKATLSEMAELKGRDTEKDLFGKPGGYRTVMSKNTAGQPCPACGGSIRKENYLGGSIYYCEGCQIIP